MKRTSLVQAARLAFPICALPLVSAQEVNVTTLPPPSGMVLIAGGEFLMGATTAGHGSGAMAMPSNDAEPVHPVFVDDFWMDATAVTNEQFEEFVKATGYVTIAERAPTKEEVPTAPVENLVAGSVVFAPTDQEVPLNDHLQWWTYVKGANWRHPEGPESGI
ncbi:MAG: SUMF1/EgtB/PvdO family nonheme iron enzyme, partial [Nitrospira sp.]